MDFVWDNLGEPVREETFTHSHSSWSSIIPICFRHLLRSMASSLFNPRGLQSFSTISLPSFLWSTSWPGTLHFILHTILHPIIVFFSQYMPIPSQPVLCSTEIMSSKPSLPLNCTIHSRSLLTTITVHLFQITNYHFTFKSVPLVLVSSML